MADIEIRRSGEGHSLKINGVDYSMEVYSGAELVAVGEGAFAEIGLRVTFAVSSLSLDHAGKVSLVGNLPEAAAQVREITGEPHPEPARPGVVL